MPSYPSWRGWRQSINSCQPVTKSTFTFRPIPRTRTSASSSRTTVPRRTTGNPFLGLSQSRPGFCDAGFSMTLGLRGASRRPTRRALHRPATGRRVNHDHRAGVLDLFDHNADNPANSIPTSIFASTMPHRESPEARNNRRRVAPPPKVRPCRFPGNPRSGRR